MESESQVDDLVDRWEVMRSKGMPLSIEELCNGHPELAAEVRRQIKALQAVDSAFGTEVHELVSTTRDRGDDGAGLERGVPEVSHATAVYHLEGHHGHGGLGVVFTAHHEQLDRKVALKRIRPDRLSDKARRRFLREAAITARLQHPGILPIYSLGQDESGPFYTMPLIEGQTLQAAIDSFHNDDAGRRGLRLRELLQHFVAASNTVAYAHDQAVVHRDLKPSNIMLGRYGETLVLDWGLAKQLGTDDAAGDGDGDLPSPESSSEDVTATGEVLGTPRYMSPEQARGEPAGALGDIFSLGLVLYAILTRKSAFDEWNLPGANRLWAVRGAAIVPSRRRDASLPRALEAICLKALASRSEDRYVSARALAEDVTRWLADEPVMAWQEPLAFRSRRWMRRHRTLVTSTAAVLILSLAGLAGFTLVLAEKNAELAKQSQALDDKNAELSRKNTELDRQRQRTEEREILAIDAVKKFRDTVTSNLALKTRPELRELRTALLAEPLELFRALRDRLLSDRDRRPNALAKLVLATLDLADTTRQIGSIPDAICSYTEAITILEGLARDIPADAECQRALAITHSNLGILLRATGRTIDALESQRQARAIFEQLVRDHPDKPEYRSELATCLNNFGISLNDTGHAAEALESYRKSLAIRERLALDHPTIDEYQCALAESYNNFSLLPQSLAEASLSLSKALAIRERLARDRPAIPEHQGALATIYTNMANVLRDQGQLTEALESLERARRICEQRTRDHPAVADYQSDLALCYNNFGVILRDSGRGAESLEWHRRALAIRERLAHDHPSVTDYQSDLAQSQSNLGVELNSAGRPSEALESYRRAKETWERLTRDNPQVHNYQSLIGVTLHNMADVENHRGRQKAACEYLKHALERQRAALAAMPGHPVYQQYVRLHLAGIAELHRALNQPHEAIRVTHELSTVSSGNPSDLYNVACALALSVPLTTGKQQKELAAEAVQILEQAIAAGWHNAAKACRDPELAPIRDHDEFRRLMAQLFDRDFPADAFAP